VAAEGGDAVAIQSAGYYVDARWHGPASAALFLALVKFQNRYHCSVGTANEASAAVWKAFRAAELPGSGEESCCMSPRIALVEEAVVRRLPFVRKLLPRGAPKVRAGLPLRMSSFRKRLGDAVVSFGCHAIDQCAAYRFQGAGAIPTASLLRWRLSAPDPRYELLQLRSAGLNAAAFFTASTRGHRGQAATLNVSAIWGPAWESDPKAVFELIKEAARHEFPFLTVGFSPAPESVRAALRLRRLDAPRRWFVRSPAQPAPLPGWNGLDAL
jgi:hypothetical protein